jgi:hypothetical protein
MPKTKPVVEAGTHFVVERLNWRRSRGDTFYRYPGRTRVASFDTAEEAEAFRRVEEAKARAAVNPFAGTLAPPTDQTSMPEGVLCDWLQDHGIDPPAPKKSGPRDWAKWWEKAAPRWTDAQRAAAWEALDRVRFFRVGEQPHKPVAYAVVQVVWGYNDEWFYPGAEGGQVQTLYRTRERAEAEAARRNAEERENWVGMLGEDGVGYEPAGVNQFELEGRLLPGQDPFGPAPKPARADEEDEEGDEIFTYAPDEVPFYEVIEVELEGVA